MVVEVYTQGCGGCWTLFDNLTVNPNFTPPPPPTPTPVPQTPPNTAYNYLTNGCFANGNTGWNVWPGTDGDASTNGNWYPPNPNGCSAERIHYKATNFEVSTYSNVINLPQTGS